MSNIAIYGPKARKLAVKCGYWPAARWLVKHQVTLAEALEIFQMPRRFA